MSGSTRVTPPNQIHLLAYAKVNLSLKVYGQRHDGYHFLSMINVSVSLADEVRISFSPPNHGACPEVTLTISGIPCPQGVGNLVQIAAERYLSMFHFPYSVEIDLKKRIPVGGGLGGGSSDAAATLRVLLWVHEQIGSAPSLADFESCALAIGADVPYLLMGGAALVQGIGEKVQPLALECVEGVACLLLVPPFGLSTREVFQNRVRLTKSGAAYSESRTADHETGHSLQSHDKSVPHTYDEVLHSIRNDLLESAVSLAPALQLLLTSLEEEPSFVVGMSGSGSTLFVLPRHPDALHSEMVPSVEQKIRAYERRRLSEGDELEVDRVQIIPCRLLSKRFALEQLVIPNPFSSEPR